MVRDPVDKTRLPQQALHKWNVNGTSDVERKTAQAGRHVQTDGGTTETVQAREVCTDRKTRENIPCKTARHNPGSSKRYRAVLAEPARWILAD